MKKLKLHGFNNLTRTLSFNIYDICYAKSPDQCRAYIEYIDEVYNAIRLTEVLTDVSRIIGAEVLSIAHQDYDPQGASVTMLIAEEAIEKSASIVAHLNKSHITVHTYPESHPEKGISTFRADIDVSTCGMISPLHALNFLIGRFDSDIVTIDYRVRGFTRDIKGLKHFIDHPIHSVQNYLSKEIENAYEMIDVNVYQENMFHTKMLLKNFEFNNYLFGIKEEDLAVPEAEDIKWQLKREMQEIFYGRNLPRILS